MNLQTKIDQKRVSGADFLDGRPESLAEFAAAVAKFVAVHFDAAKVVAAAVAGVAVVGEEECKPGEFED